MNKQYWHLLSDKEIKDIIKGKHNFSWIMNNYKQPDWCKHANAIAPGAFGCERLMNNKNAINLESCSHCEHFKRS